MTLMSIYSNIGLATFQPLSPPLHLNRLYLDVYEARTNITAFLYQGDEVLGKGKGG